MIAAYDYVWLTSTFIRCIFFLCFVFHTIIPSCTINWIVMFIDHTKIHFVFIQSICANETQTYVSYRQYLSIIYRLLLMSSPSQSLAIYKREKKWEKKTNSKTAHCTLRAQKREASIKMNKKKNYREWMQTLLYKRKLATDQLSALSLWLTCFLFVSAAVRFRKMKEGKTNAYRLWYRPQDFHR